DRAIPTPGGGALPPPRRSAPIDSRWQRQGEVTMTTTTRETEITADSTVPLIRITREFDAPPAKVFRAHTDPELLVKWLGPRDLEMRVDTFDCRTGGSYRYVHTRGQDEFGFHGCFHEVRPSELIVQTFTFE